MVGDQCAFDKGAGNGPGNAKGAVSQLGVDAVGFDKVAGYLANEFPVLGSTDVVDPEEVTKIVPVGLNTLSGGVVRPVIAILVAGRMEAKGHHGVGDVALYLGDADGVWALGLGATNEQIPEGPVSRGRQTQRGGGWV